MTAAPGSVALRRGSAWLGLAIVLLGTVLGTFNNGVANVALPDVLDEFGVPVSVGAWFVTSYVLALAVALPVAGRLVDTYGSRKVSLVGLTAFLVVSVLLAAAPGYGWVIAARVGQGVCNAPVLPTIMVTVVAAFEPGARGKAMGTWVAVNGASFAVSPLIAGWLTETASWRAVFWLNVVLTVLALIASVALFPDVPPSRSRGRFDAVGAALVSVGLVGVMVSLSRAEAWGWTSLSTSTLLAGGVAALVAAVRRFRRTDDPFLDVTILRRRAYATPAAIAALQALVLFGILLITPLMFVHLFGYSLGIAGALVFVLPGSWTLTSPLVGHAADRFGRRAVLVMGTFLLAGGSGLLAFGAATRLLVLVIVAMLAVGVGVAAVQATAAVAVSEAVGRVGRGASTGAFHTLRFLAGVAGATLFAVLVEVVSGTGDLEAASDSALGRAFVAVLAAAVVTSLVAVALTRYADLGEEPRRYGTGGTAR
ncbi:MAG: MFS transporter [Actinobacteria bacterium]|nr:MFS transporter [Actinomycetota bacterium]